MFWNKKINKQIDNKEDNLEVINEKDISEKQEDKEKSNIFEDFDINSELGEEVNEIKTKLDKDKFYYLLYFANIIKYFNLFIIFIGILLYSYISIQNNDSLENNSLLDPICSIILGNKINNDGSLCSSLAVVNKKYSEDLTKLKDKIFKSEIKSLPNIYKKENFLNSKEIIFLLEKGDFRLRPLPILSEFDRLKNKFEPLLKTSISCDNINITDNFILTANCYAYSSSWNNGGILGFTGKHAKGNKDTKGTSISVASSFLNFLEVQKESKLFLIDKQKTFSTEDIVDTSSSYTKRTPFVIKMKYSENNLSL